MKGWPLPPSRILTTFAKRVFLCFPPRAGCGEVGQSVGKCNLPFANDFAFHSQAVFFFPQNPLDPPTSENLQGDLHTSVVRSYTTEMLVSGLWCGLVARTFSSFQARHSSRREWQWLHCEFLHSKIITKYVLWGALRDSGFLIYQLHKIKSELVYFSLSEISCWFIVAQGEPKPKFLVH